MYERICGMTGTAATQAEEFWKVYKLPVTVIPTNRPVIRQDLPDIVYADKEAREPALVEEIRKVHADGPPDSGRHGERGGIGAAEPPAADGGNSAFGPECKERRGRSGDHRPGGRARRRDDLDQHGGTRHRHSAGRKSAEIARRWSNWAVCM